VVEFDDEPIAHRRVRRPDDRGYVQRALADGGMGGGMVAARQRAILHVQQGDSSLVLLDDGHRIGAPVLAPVDIQLGADVGRLREHDLICGAALEGLAELPPVVVKGDSDSARLHDLGGPLEVGGALFRQIEGRHLVRPEANDGIGATEDPALRGDLVGIGLVREARMDTGHPQTDLPKEGSRVLKGHPRQA